MRHSARIRDCRGSPALERDLSWRLHNMRGEWVLHATRNDEVAAHLWSDAG